MRRVSLAVVVVAAIIASYGLGWHHAQSQTSSRTGRHVLYYVDPMHPAYKSDRPGIAPDCGMQLEPVFSQDVVSTPATLAIAGLPPGAVSIDDTRQQLLGIRLAPVERSSATRSIRVVGRVVPEDTRTYRINSGVDGFIRQTYNDSVGTIVKKDQKLATYYSPEFLSVASGFLAASERVPGSVGSDGNRTVAFPGAVSKQGTSSLQGYSDRLRNLGMSDVQIKQIADTRQLPENIDVVAPADGVILFRNLTPGQHFDHSMEFYRIADLSHVWIVAEVSEQEAPLLRSGGLAKVTLASEGRKLTARITDSLPQSEVGGGTVKLRLEVDNPGLLLRPEILVDVELPVHRPPTVTVPVDAVIDSGSTARVYVEHGDGIFEPRVVQTGWRSAEQVEILHGVQPGERVVASATFLVDSESRLKTASSGLLTAHSMESQSRAIASETVSASERDPICGKLIDRAEATASGNTLARGSATYYFCSKQCKEAFHSEPSASAGKPKRQGDGGD